MKLYIHHHITYPKSGYQGTRFIGAFDSLQGAQDALKPTIERMVQHNPAAAYLLEWRQPSGSGFWTNLPKDQRDIPHSIIVEVELNQAL